MRAKLLLQRLLVVGLSALLAVGGLVVLLAWVALEADWEQAPEAGQLSAPTVVLDRDGETLARFTSEVDRRPVGLDEVSEEAQRAMVAAEDVRFYEHGGVDPLAVVRAVTRNVFTGNIEQGGSTLTQQYVRNGYEQIGRQRTVTRKIREAVISIQLERQQTKDEILERYLNTVYFGEGAHGIEAAALTYFGKPAAELTAAEAAALAQALPAPSARNPRTDPEGAEQRRNRVLTIMEQQGWLDPSEATRARGTTLDVRPRQPATFEEPYFTAYVRRQLEHAFGTDRVLTGGLRVQTTLDRDVHAALETAVEEHLPPQDGEDADVSAGAVALDPNTGDILGMYGGRDFFEHQLNLATQGIKGNGSAFKPFAFVAALEEGIGPDRIYPAPRSIRIPASRCSAYDGPTIQVSGAAPGGAVPLREGLVTSVNSVFIQVACDVGGAKVAEVAERLGVRAPLTPNPAIALGQPAVGATVLDMASAFGTIANNGYYCPARSILTVQDPDGDPLAPIDEVTTVPDGEVVRRTVGEYPPTPRSVPDELLEQRPEELRERDRGRCKAMLDPSIARTTTEVLEQVVERGTGTRARIERPQAGKTGTTQEASNAWFVGYTPDVVVAVWVGHRGQDRPLRGIEGFRTVYGGTIPALIWKSAAQEILAQTPPRGFPEPGALPARDRRRPGPPTRPAASPSPSPSPSPDTSPTPTDSPTDEPPGPDDEPSEEPSDEPTGPRSPDGDPCLPVFDDCE